MAIRTIGTGGDFSSPQAWEASLPSTLIEQEVARILDDLSGLSDAAKTFDINVITSAVADIVIEGWNGVENKARQQKFKGPNGDVPVISYGRGGTYGLVTLRNNANHVTVRNLTSKITKSSSYLIRDIRTTAPADSYFRHENLYSYVEGGSGAVFITSYTKGYAKNCVYVSGNSGVYDTGDNFDVENCTIAGNLTGATNTRSGVRYNDSLTRKNAVFNFGPTSGFKCYLNNAAIFEDNASSDTSGNSGLQSLNLLDQYVDPVNHDWSFKAGNVLEGGASDGGNIGAYFASVPTSTAITSDIDIRTGIRQAVVTDLDIRFAIVEALSSIISDVDIRNRILTSVSSNLDIRNLIYTALSSDLDIRTNIYQSLNSDVEIRNQIFTFAQSDLDLRYSVVNSIHSDLDIRLSMAGVVLSDIDVRNGIYSTVSSDLDLRFQILQVLLSDIDVRQQILSVVESDIDLRFQVVNAVNSDIDLRNQVFDVVSSDIDIRYAVNGYVKTFHKIEAFSFTLQDDFHSFELVADEFSFEIT